MRELREKVALVTGASSGIGAAIAVELAAQGAHLALVGRDQERLNAVAARATAHGVSVKIHIADLDREEDLNSLKAAVDDDFGRLDILVHSAGVFEHGLVEDMPAESLLRQFRVNTLAPYALTHLFLPVIRRRRGQIVFVNSRAGLVAPPTLTQYAATKHALRAIADGLREEVSRDGVRVLSVYPGKTATPLQQRIQEAAGNKYDPSLFPQPEDVARLVVSALTLPANAEMTDVIVRPQQEPYQ
ncbi:MAG TPA: SDR family oxidoreductase [Candidatus Hydrogenedentes bacterium]|nr:SDR family oxidoreductase [Candidatus Hydrogenedentota bacterium]HNT86231.1 SDR family oxidoreductase [Candidatus Hydrogenedentota bacterium]